MACWDDPSAWVLNRMGGPRPKWPETTKKKKKKHGHGHGPGPGPGPGHGRDLTKVIPPVETPNDTKWVKHIKIQSNLLTKFWGQPIYLGATVLLPKGYDSHSSVSYPVLYEQGHFGLGPPMRFNTHADGSSEHAKARLAQYNLETGYQFFEAWNSDSFPRRCDRDVSAPHALF